MKWPYEGRVDAAHAWGVIAVGTAGLVAIPTILATLHAADSHFRWWWPTNWMIVPAAIFLVGLGLTVLPVMRPVNTPLASTDTFRATTADDGSHTATADAVAIAGGRDGDTSTMRTSSDDRDGNRELPKATGPRESGRSSGPNPAISRVLPRHRCPQGTPLFPTCTRMPATSISCNATSKPPESLCGAIQLTCGQVKTGA